MKSLSIVMPCYNEQDAIPTVIPRTLGSLEALRAAGKIENFELIVVNDKSTDDSVNLLSQYPQVSLLHTNGTGRGYGKALKLGFSKASSDWIGFLDVDNSYRPEDFELFVDEIGRGESDFVMGQRSFCEKGMSFTRGFGNGVYVVLARLFYGSRLTDVCSGFRFFHRRYVSEILAIPEQGLDFSIHLTLKMISQKTFVKPIPIQYDPRLGESKLSVFSDGLAFLKVLISLKLRGLGVIKHSRV